MVIQPDCSFKGGAIKEVLISNASDWKLVNGQLVLKRKYGKFKRTIVRANPKDLK